MHDTKPRTSLAALVFTDMVGSTAIKQELGDHGSAEVFRRHHEIVRETLRRFPRGDEIETAGDSFLLAFATPSEAVQFALTLQARLREPGNASTNAAADRIGIHLGEVVLEAGPESRKTRNMFGLSIDTCARVMGLAGAGQILLTRAAFDSARQVLKGGEIEGVTDLRWLNHGAYLLRGIEEPVEVCEVGEAGRAPLEPPRGSEKAQRRVLPDDEPVLGWRPAIGQVVPSTQWVFEEKLGEGGFGEVWLARHAATKERRVFKFCFRADRVRSLKRETTLFRLIKERIGDHPNIVALRDVYLEAPPFYVAMDYVAGSDLRSWCDEAGGTVLLPLETSLELVAQIADALQAAHDAGVVHRDVKPGNILVEGTRSEATDPSRILAKLTDFGIGQVISEEALQGMTGAGFTKTLFAESSSSHTGSQLYMAPELLAGRPASIRSDVYSLGVVLYQLLVADFSRPLTTDWAADISDPLIRNDLQHCFAGNPQDRFVGAGQLATNLRALPERRLSLAKQEAESAARERAAYRMGVMRTAAGAILLIALVSALAAFAWRTAQRQRLNAYVADMNVAHLALLDYQVARTAQLVEKYRRRRPWEEDLRGLEWRLLWHWSRPDEHSIVASHDGQATCAVFSPDGTLLASGGHDGKVVVVDARSKRAVRSFEGLGGDIQQRAMAFSRDGRLLAVKAGSHVRVWHTESWLEACPPLAAEPGAINVSDDTLVFSPDGSTLATRVPGGVGYWDTATCHGPTVIPGDDALGPYSADGKFMLSHADPLQIRAINVQSSEHPVVTTLVRRFDVPERLITVASSRELIAGGYRDGVVKLWRIGSWEELATFKAHPSFILGLDFSPDGQTLATTSGMSHVVKLWDVADVLRAASTHQVVRPDTALKGHARGVNSVAFSPDRRSLASASFDGTVRWWNAPARGGDRTLRDSAFPFWFSPDGTQLVVLDGNDSLRRWRVSDLHDFGPIVPVDAGDPNHGFLALSPDGRSFALAHEDGTIQHRDLESGRLLKTWSRHGGQARCVTFAPSGDQVAAEIATGADRWSTRVWDLASGKELRVFAETQCNGVQALAFSPNGKELAFAGADRQVRVGDVASGRVRVMSAHPPPYVESLAFTPDGRWLAVGSLDASIGLGQIRSGRLTPAFELQGRAPLLAFTPDGKTLVSASWDSLVTFWNVALRKEMMTLPNFAPASPSLLIAPSGNALAVTAAQSTGAHGLVELWSVPTLAEIDASYPSSDRPPSSPAAAPASPDSRR